MSNGETVSLYELEDSVNDIISDFVDKLDIVSASDLGLDNRAGSKLYVGEDLIAVSKSGDGKLQYYGGFEYVECEFRQEFGGWVFYSAEDDSGRVSACLSRLSKKEDANV